MKHIPVLLHEVIEVLDPKPGEFLIDGTANGGGHLEAIIGKMEGVGRVIAIEWDKDILERTKAKVEDKFQIPNPKFQIKWANDNYANLPEIIEKLGWGRADGLLLDLGFSTEQLYAKKGFSYAMKANVDEPLDMRYSKEGGRQTAAEAINSLREDELADIVFKYGEERFARRIAHAICEKRKSKRIVGTQDLVETVKSAVPKFFKKGEMDAVSRVFQSLRIYVNDEFGNIERVLGDIKGIVNPGGRVAIITFHSLEDRIVKNAFKEMEKLGEGELINKKPIMPSDEELKSNPASRSAKLRAIRIEIVKTKVEKYQSISKT